MARLDRTPVGIAVIDDRWVESNLHAVDSTVTEAGPRPGGAVAVNSLQDAIPVVSGAQHLGVDLSVTKSGDPSIERRGAAFAWKLDTEASSEWRGWSSPVWCSRASTVHQSTTAAITAIGISAKRDSGKVSILYSEGASTPTSTRVLTDSTQILSASDPVEPSGVAGPMRGPAAMCEIPDGRRLVLDWYGPANLQGPTVFAEVNPGSGFVELSADPFPGGTAFISGTAEHLSMQYSRGQLCLLIVDTNNNLHQLASADLGASFRFVETVAARSDADLAVFADGTILITHHDTSANSIKATTIGHAFQALSTGGTVAATDASSATAPHAVCIDDDGTAYLFVSRADVGASNPDYLRLLESTDGGISWSNYSSSPVAADPAGAGFDLVRAVASQGRIYLLAVDDQSGAGPRGVSLFTLSGWSNLVPGANHTNPARPGFGFVAANNGECGAYWSSALPWSGITGYTGAGAGTASLAGSTDDRYLQISTTASARYYAATDGAATDGDDRVICWSMLVHTGGSISSSNSVYVTIRTPDASGNRQWVQVRFSETQLRIFDMNSGAGSGTVAIDMNVRRDFCLHLTGSTVRLFERSSPADNWTERAQIIGITSSGAFGQTNIYWGQGTLTAISQWWWFSHRVVGGTMQRQGSLGPDVIIGKRIARDGYPLPGAGSLSGAEPVILARLGVQGGHARKLGATDYNIDPDHDFAIGNVFATGSPSPDQTWRSTSSVLQQIAIGLDPAYDTRLSSALPLLVVRNANFRTLILEARTSAAGSYTTVGTLDLGAEWFGFSYALTGNVITCTAGTGTASRWIHADELIGGYVEIATALGGTVFRPIVSNTAGVPLSTASVPTVIRIGGIDGTEAATGSACRIIHHSGILVCSGFVPTDYRFWRVRAPAQTTFESYVEAGTIGLASVIVPGKRWSNGWTWTREPNIGTSETAGGTKRAEQRGPMRRVLSFGWADGAKVDRVRRDPSGVDHLSINATSAPLAGRGDAWWELESLQDRSKGGEIPVIVVLSIPAATSTITDPSLYVCGLLEGSVAVSHVSGDPLDRGEFVRIEQMTVTELV